MILEKLNDQPHINNYKLFLSIKTNCILNFSGQQEVLGFKQKCMQPLCVSSSKTKISMSIFFDTSHNGIVKVQRAELTCDVIK